MANIVDATNLKVIKSSGKLHNMVVTACAFHPLENYVATVSTDYCYRFTSTAGKSVLSFLSQLVMRLGLLFVILLVVIDYIY